MSITDLTAEQRFSLARTARRVEVDTEALTLVNNITSAGLVAQADTSLAALKTLVDAANPLVAPIANGQQVTVPVTGTYVSKATFTVADGVITAIVLS